MNYVTPAAVARARVDRRARPRAAAHLPDVVARRGRGQGAAADPLHAQDRAGRRSASPAATTATPPRRARSLSDPEVHAGGPAHFAWPRVPHPAQAGTAATIAALRAAVEAAGGPAKVLGFFYEPVQERTGAVLPPDFLAALSALRTELDLPLIAVETASRTYRSGTRAVPVARRRPRARRPGVVGRRPDRLPPLRGAVVRRPGRSTLVSTWDGDELSLVRQHHYLRAARQLDIAGSAPRAALERALARACRSSGLGAYRVIDAGDRGRRSSRRSSPGAASPCAASPAAGSASRRPSIRSRPPPPPSARRSGGSRDRAGAALMRVLELPAGEPPREWGRIHGESFRGEIQRARGDPHVPLHEGRRVPRRGDTCGAPPTRTCPCSSATTPGCTRSCSASPRGPARRPRTSSSRTTTPTCATSIPIPPPGCPRRRATRLNSASAPVAPERRTRRRWLQRALGRVADGPHPRPDLGHARHRDPLRHGAVRARVAGRGRRRRCSP